VYNTEEFPTTNTANNYFAPQNSDISPMNTIEEVDKSNIISKHDLAIPPDKIMDQDDSLYTTTPFKQPVTDISIVKGKFKIDFKNQKYFKLFLNSRTYVF